MGVLVPDTLGLKQGLVCSCMLGTRHGESEGLLAYLGINEA